MTGKVKAPNFIEIGHVVPAVLDPVDDTAIRAAVPEFLDLLGVRDGPAHTEVICDGNGVHLVESHIRVGGDQIPRLVELALGINLYDWAVNRILCGGFVESVPVHPRCAAAIAFVPADPGTVVEIDGVTHAASLPGVAEVDVSASIGGRVSPLHHSFGRCGSVIATGASPGQALRRAQQAAAAILVRTVPDQADGHPGSSDRLRRYARGLT